IDKATNLEAIAKALNIGLDALVLLDDNPAERAQVRKALPMVRVPEVPDDAAWFAWTLEAGGWFEAVTFSAEDADRVKMQAQDVRRAELMSGARDLTDYLRSLGMTISFRPFDAQGRQRIVQLINKTNQFNLTTRRYTEAQVSEMEAAPSVLTLQVRLTDRFGDLGMIAVIIGRSHPEHSSVLELDSWLMSCRVLGRQVEAATLSVIAARAKEMGIASLLGTYIPTDKNMLVENHYGKLGFTRAAGEPDGRTIWELDLASYEPPAFPMTLSVDET
ncbi:HAD-IIIC family phosphatase, partial [Aestuariivirga sp.]|uniref:HAD-IIIC family phosphatase n=1 Tax=Aestuariivirga sp. TaxID=2650926 RepID=UPI0035941AFF